MTTDAHGFCGECDGPATDATGQPNHLNQLLTSLANLTHVDFDRNP